MHGDQIGADPFADIGGAKRPVLDEHIHLYPMSEGFVCNQTGNFWRGDDVIFSRNHTGSV